jgi:hypothetical protein
MQKVLILTTKNLDIRDNVIDCTCESGYKVREEIDYSKNKTVSGGNISEEWGSLDPQERNLQCPLIALGFAWKLASVCFDNENKQYVWFFVKES